MSIRETDWFQYAASQSCTHPEALEWLHDAVLRLGTQPNQKYQLNIAEIGCWAGGSSIVLFDAMRRFGGCLTCIDDFSQFKGKDGPKPIGANIRGRFLDNVKWYLERTGEKFVLSDDGWPGPGAVCGGRHSTFLSLDARGSPVASERISDAIFSIVFIDGDHTYDGVMTDLQAFVPKVRPGGIVVGHDFLSEPGVAEAVREFFGREPMLAPGDLWTEIAT